MLASGGEREARAMADNKTKPTKLSVAEFVDGITDETQARGRQGTG